MTSDPIATLALGVGTKIMCATHRLIMLFLSVKFLIKFALVVYELSLRLFVTDGQMDGWCNFNMLPEVSSGA